MPQTPLTPVTLKQNNYAALAGDLAITPVVMDAVNGNSFVATGKEILLFQNPDAAAHTVTITSVADALGRTDASLIGYSIPATSLAMIQMSQLAGWIQPGQTVFLATNSALVKVAVLRTN
jgi:hypothetical protein